jgi:hypothetical protein
MCARRLILIGIALSVGVLSAAVASHAASFPEFVDPHPAPGNQFGAFVVPLSTGNVVIASPHDNAGGTNTGAVYLFNGANGALISTLRGSSVNDEIGQSGVTALPSGNFVIQSPFRDNGGAVDAGAVTWGSGTTGVSGVVSAANSLVGTSAGDYAGIQGVTVLSNGNYVVSSQNWNNGAATSAGAATWGSGTSGVSGAISAANSLIGSTTNDDIGAAIALTNGNYVVWSSSWSNGAIASVGAVTRGNGTTGTSGVVTAANSLVGSTSSDMIGSGNVTALTNGNYVVRSPAWDNVALMNAGAVTWASGTTGITGAVSAANSLVGSKASDQVGSGGVTALTNGSYVVMSPIWDNGATVDAGAATWCSGTTGRTGTISSANSLVGSTTSDQVGSGVVPLTNGNYVVRSTLWDNGAVANAGAATWGSGTTGVSGVISAANSLVGSITSDQVGVGVTPLTNGNYVVVSSVCDVGGTSNAGAATWGSGTTGVSGAVSAANSLVGTTVGDQVGFVLPVALTNGNYVVLSRLWHNGAVANAGAATWGSGTTGISGAVSVANSLVGSTAGDAVGGAATALTNGNYVVSSTTWDNGSIVDAGAATWCNGTTGLSGSVTTANSLVGSTASDLVGIVSALPNGNYVVLSSNWDNGSIANAGAATLGSGTSGVVGTISAANSLVGSTANDDVGSGGVKAFASGDYVVTSPSWDNGSVVDAGAASFCSGTSGLIAAVSGANSVVSFNSSTQLLTPVLDNVNDTYLARFLSDEGGHVRVGPPANAPVILSALDIPSDQGGWLRLTFNRSILDFPFGSVTVSNYGVWRHQPGTSALPAGGPSSYAAGGAALAAGGAALAGRDVEHLLAALPEDLDVREVAGRYFVTASSSHVTRTPHIATAFPPGTWELVASVPALQQAQYVAVVPTVSNAAPNDFVVTAHTNLSWIWFVSLIASGQSVDNLAPPPPSPFAAAFSSGATHLHWGVSTASDFGTFKLYRGTSAAFVPAPGNMVVATTDTGYADVGVSGYYYKLSAVDVNGNESTFALVSPDGTLDVAGDVKLEFALAGATPNPARGNRLMVDFTLPVAEPARLEMMDVAGRRVADRQVGGLGAGRHVLNLAESRPLSPGIYLIKLTQGARSKVARAAVIQ